MLSSLVESITSLEVDSNDASTAKSNVVFFNDFTDEPPEKLIDDVSVKMFKEETVEHIEIESENELYHIENSTDTILEYDNITNKESSKDIIVKNDQQNKISAEELETSDSEVKLGNSIYFVDDDTNDTDSYEYIEYLENDKDVSYVAILKNDNAEEYDKDLNIVNDELIIPEEILEPTTMLVNILFLNHLI